MSRDLVVLDDSLEQSLLENLPPVYFNAFMLIRRKGDMLTANDFALIVHRRTKFDTIRVSL